MSVVAPASSTTSTAVDTLRALAIALVLAHHVHAYGGFSVPYLDLNGGLLGVQLFFLISGFLIVRSAERYPLGVFALHRFFRIFPPYLCALLVFAAAKWVLVPSYRQALEGLAPYFVLNVLNLQLLHPASVLLLDPLHVGWSLTVELVWYALAPLAVWWCRGHDRMRWLVLLAASVALSCAWVYCASRGLLAALYEPLFARVGLSTQNAVLRHGVVDNAPPAQLMFFVMGACLHVFRAELARVPSAWLWLVAAVVLLFVPQWNAQLQLFPNPLTGVGMAALCLWVMRGGYGDALTRWLAQVSYSVYLIHAPLLLWVFDYLQWRDGRGLTLALALIALGAHWGWFFVERPAQALGRRWADRVLARGATGEGCRV